MPITAVPAARLSSERPAIWRWRWHATTRPGDTGRIHGELTGLGYPLASSTVRKILRGAGTHRLRIRQPVGRVLALVRGASMWTAIVGSLARSTGEHRWVGPRPLPRGAARVTEALVVSYAN